MKAIERIAGYACEVNEDQWRELVKVADEVGLKVCPLARRDGIGNGRHNYARVNLSTQLSTLNETSSVVPIPYPEFLAKLKGEEKWEPKNGEELEVMGVDCLWHIAEFVGVYKGYYVCRFNNEFIGFQDVLIRPLRPTITRAEAEQKLKELGVNARIVD